MEKTLRQVWKTTGKKPKDLEKLDNAPQTLNYLWRWYMEMGGHQPLSYTEIHYWNALSHANVKAWEVDIIKSLDRLFWGLQNGRNSRTRDKSQQKRRR